MKVLIKVAASGFCDLRASTYHRKSALTSPSRSWPFAPTSCLVNDFPFPFFKSHLSLSLTLLVLGLFGWKVGRSWSSRFTWLSQRWYYQQTGSLNATQFSIWRRLFSRLTVTSTLFSCQLGLIKLMRLMSQSPVDPFVIKVYPKIAPALWCVGI